MEGRDTFLAAGGKEFHYIPTTNDLPAFMAALTDIALENLQGWAGPGWDAAGRGGRGQGIRRPRAGAGRHELTKASATMTSLLLRWLLSALALLAVAYLYPGVRVDSFFAAAMAALVLGLVNAVIRPILVILTLPVTIITLGLFLFVINALLFWLVAEIVKGFTVHGLPRRPRGLAPLQPHHAGGELARVGREEVTPARANPGGRRGWRRCGARSASRGRRCRGSGRR